MSGIAEIDLTPGCIDDLLTKENCWMDAPSNAVVQVLFLLQGFKNLTTKIHDVYQLFISDGQHTYSNVMLSPGLSHLVTQKQIQKFGVIQIIKVKVESTKHVKMLTIYSAKVLDPGNNVRYVIGKPVPWIHPITAGIVAAAIFAGTDIDLECPVCINYFKNPIFQCLNGHLLCETCELICKLCPVCREPMPDKDKKIRNLVLEKILAAISKKM